MRVLCVCASACETSFGNLLEELLETDEKLITKILTTINHIAEHNGHPHPPHAKRIYGTDTDIELCEIRLHYDKENLLRIYYVPEREQKQLKLLNYILKPDGTKKASQYEGKAKKKLEKEIQESIQLAIQLYKQINKNDFSSL